MKLKKVLLALFVLIFLIALGGYFYVNSLSNSAIPNYEVDVKIDNLKSPVTVFRDEYAIPHIYAENTEDLYRATGYIMAQDRLWQMDLIRRVTSGRLSEIFGPDMLMADRLFRSLRIPEKSTKLLANEPPELVASLDAFTDGVNQYMESLGTNLPIEFKLLGYQPDKWESQHSLNLVGYMSWDLSMAWATEIMYDKISQHVSPEQFNELFPDLLNQKTSVYPNFSYGELSSTIEEALIKPNKQIQEMGLYAFQGSNNWAIAGNKNPSGKPIICNDMHLGLNAPGIWYQIHQVVPGVINVTGLALPGQPMVVAGHNDSIAWGMTNVMLDDIDFYRETINPENPNQYKFNGEWKDLKVKKERIATKEGDTIDIEIKFTHRGPIISKNKGLGNDAVSMRWIGNEHGDEVRGVYLLNYAKNYTDFRNAVKNFVAISQNFVYGDVQGNIAMQNTAGVALREGNRMLVAPGDTDLYDWKGFVPFDSLPYSFNPPEGYVSSANNKTVDDDYPYYISSWFALPYRINRIREMLTSKEILTVDDMKAMHGDQKSNQVELYLPKIIESLENTELSPLAQKAFAKLKNWDGNETKESVATSIYEMTYVELCKSIFLDELGDDLYAEYISQKLMADFVLFDMFTTGNEVSWCDNTNTEKVEMFSDNITEAFENAVEALKIRMGESPDNWKWGEMHTLTLKHPLGKVNMLNKVFNLNRGPFPVGGSYHTVSPYSYPFKDLFNANHGASHRHIFTAANWDNSQTVIPTGQSGIPASQHYCDQTELYLQVKYHNDYISKKLVEQNTKYTMKLLPKE